MSETKGDSQAKSFTAEEIGKHNTRDDVWIVISNKVYNVTNFLDEHPGGEEVILENAGKDATNDFDDIGHSEDAREMLKDYLIGELKGAPPTGAQGAKGSADSHLRSQQNNSWGLLIPLAFAAALVAYKMYA
ncbi:Cytochrome b5 [Coemansia sp. RSA 2702]|nr:Cytochrome b5 [Coemansia sp. RSA 2702]